MKKNYCVLACTARALVSHGCESTAEQPSGGSTGLVFLKQSKLLVGFLKTPLMKIFPMLSGYLSTQSDNGRIGKEAGKTQFQEE